MNWKDYFYYDESSPSCLRWKVDIMAGEYKGRVLVSKGDPAGSLNENGYYTVGLRRKQYYAHKIILEMMKGEKAGKGFKVDHEDGNRLNNKVGNLRVVSNFLNARNMGKKKHNTSGKCGVSWASPNGYHYARAQWRTLEGKVAVRMFSVNKLGLLPAFASAVKCRNEAIERMKQDGGGYTERHGE